MSKPFAWSYSALTSFETCPRRYQLTRITKEFSEPQTQHTIWGNQVHKALENRLVHNKPLPETMIKYEPIVKKLVSKGGVIRAEQKMALNRNLVPTQYFAPDVWVRGITDVTVLRNSTLFNGDWKTGKRDPDSAQLRLSAAMVMAYKPYVERSINAFIWLQSGEIDTEEVTRDDVPRVWQEFMPHVQRMENAVKENKFIPRPSGLCRKWCPCSTCEFHGERGG